MAARAITNQPVIGYAKPAVDKFLFVFRALHLVQRLRDCDRPKEGGATDCLDKGFGDFNAAHSTSVALREGSLTSASTNPRLR